MIDKTISHNRIIRLFNMETENRVPIPVPVGEAENRVGTISGFFGRLDGLPFFVAITAWNQTMCESGSFGGRNS